MLGTACCSALRLTDPSACRRDAIEVHKATSHYKAWADFKASGGVLSQTVAKSDAIDFTG